LISKQIHQLVYYPSPDSMAGKMYDSEAVLKKKYSGTEHNAVEYPYRVVKESRPDLRLIELLGFYSKEDFMGIIDAERVDIKKSVKKDIMIEMLNERIPVHFSRFLELIDEAMYQTILKISEHRVIPVKQAGKMSSCISYLIRCGYLYRIEEENHELIYFPLEIESVLNEIDKDHIEKTVKQNSTVHKIGKNILYYYGVIYEYNYENLVEEFVESYNKGNLKKSISLSDIGKRSYKSEKNWNDRTIKVINRIAEYSEYINRAYLVYPSKRWYFIYKDVIEPCNIVFEQERRETTDYLCLSLKDLLADKYLDQKPMDDMAGYLTNKLNLPYLEAVAIVNRLNLYIKNGERIMDYMSIITERLRVDRTDSINNMMEFANSRFFNDLNQWLLKGNTSKSIFLSQISKETIGESNINAIGTNVSGINHGDGQAISQKTPTCTVELNPL
jgi:cyclophilin family peptidyl-prolyl cis-trans isomerase